MKENKIQWQNNERRMEIVRNKTFLSKICLAIISIFMLSVINVFAYTPDYSVLEKSINEESTDHSITFVEQKFEWPKIKWPWSKKEKTEFDVMREKKLEKMKTRLSNLVEEGVLTQEKADVILKEYKEYINSKKFPLEQLVEDNVLTQEEANAIRDTIREKIAEKKKSGKLSKEERVKVLRDALSELIEDGVLTEEKLEAIKEYYEQKKPQMKEQKKNRGFWNELITKGIITKEEAETIRKSIKKNCKGGKGINK